jgi:3-deoxy-D-manno-octulosonate 8-phosphate phosphatase KdsC-like HAD superfamily phosphatase
VLLLSLPKELESARRTGYPRYMSSKPTITIKDHFASLPDELRRRLKKLKMLILDVDGVMTDGRVFWVEGTGWTRMFSVKDGYGLKLLMKAGIEVGVISGGDSKSVRERAQFLGIKHVYLGDENKVVALEKNHARYWV